MFPVLYSHRALLSSSSNGFLTFHDFWIRHASQIDMGRILVWRVTIGVEAGRGTEAEMSVLEALIIIDDGEGGAYHGD